MREHGGDERRGGSASSTQRRHPGCGAGEAARRTAEELTELMGSAHSTGLRRGELDLDLNPLGPLLADPGV
ncbi:hypothetical protein [Streptomyces tibetensis]|uniref:hypothetical protein n=1 Tax=Streptomyces tibetensis TaxID=2382123 RepID=UPI0033F7B112